MSKFKEFLRSEEGEISPVAENVCLANAIHVARDRHIPTWPIDAVSTEWYKDRTFLPELWNTINSLENSDFTESQIARLLQNPTRISTIFHFVKCPFDSLDRNSRLQLVEKLFGYLSYYRGGDPLCLTGKNLVKGGMELAQEVWDKKDELFTADLKKLIFEIHGIGWCHTEMLWGPIHGCGHEIHGPYQINGEQAVVREYYDLKPSEIRPATANLSFDSLTTISYYQGLEFWADMFGHTYSPPGKQGVLTGFAVLVDQRPIVDETELQKILREFLEVNKQEGKFTSGFSERDWLRKAIEMYYWTLKPLKETLGESWRPSKDAYEFIETQTPPVEQVRDFGVKWTKIWKSPSENDREERFKQFFFQNLFRV